MEQSKFLKCKSPKERYLPIAESVEKGFESEPKITDFEILQKLTQDKYEISNAISKFILKHKVTKARYILKAVDKRRNWDDEQNSFSKGLNSQNILKNYHQNFENILSYFEDSNYCYFLTEYTIGSLDKIFFNQKKKIKKKICSIYS